MLLKLSLGISIISSSQAAYNGANLLQAPPDLHLVNEDKGNRAFVHGYFIFKIEINSTQLEENVYQYHYRTDVRTNYNHL